MLICLNLYPLQIVKAVETRVWLPQEALGFTEAEHVTLAVGLWKTKVILSLWLLGPWLESKSGLLPLGCPLPQRTGTQQGHITSVWGQRQAEVLDWWADDSWDIFAEHRGTWWCCLYGLVLEMFYLIVTVSNLTNHLLKQERRVNILIFTNVSTFKDLAYVRSLDSNIYKHMQKSVHK